VFGQRGPTNLEAPILFFLDLLIIFLYRGLSLYNPQKGIAKQRNVKEKGNENESAAGPTSVEQERPHL